MRCSGVSPGAVVSPLVNPMSNSLIFGEGEVMIHPCKSRPLAGGEPYAYWWGEGDRVPKRGSRVCSGTMGSAKRGVRHSSSPAVANMTSTALGRS